MDIKNIYKQKNYYFIPQQFLDTLICVALSILQIKMCQYQMEILELTIEFAHTLCDYTEQIIMNELKKKYCFIKLVLSLESFSSILA